VPVPRELDKVLLPAYVIEPPDILEIDAVAVVPKPPYKVAPLDQLFIQATETIPEQPITGIYVVDTDGTVNLGYGYGSVSVNKMTIAEAKAAIEKHLKPILKDTTVNVQLAQSRGLQQIRGEHLVRPDGTVGLGVYGSVPVTGLTLAEAKKALETHLSEFLLEPEISIDVLGFNSKVYYIVFDGGAVGDQVYRLPVTGSETVLDALGGVYGLGPISSRRHIWIARPAPGDSCPDQILPVDWMGITRGAQTATNYQILPGDRIFVKADPWIKLDGTMAKIYAPFERTFGFILLGNSTIISLRDPGTGAGGTGTTTP